jgi:hypothetical protein
MISNSRLAAGTGVPTCRAVGNIKVFDDLFCRFIQVQTIRTKKGKLWIGYSLCVWLNHTIENKN